MSQFSLGIYRHYKGDLYKATEVVYMHDTGQAYIKYYCCDANGIFMSKRDESGKNVTANQPFIRSLTDFLRIIDGKATARFTLIKAL